MKRMVGTEVARLQMLWNPASVAVEEVSLTAAPTI